MTLLNKVWHYLPSRANCYGTGAALLVLLAHLLDWLGPGWWYLAPGAYLAAGLPFLRRPTAPARAELSTADALQQLDQTLLPRLSGDAHQVLADIIQTVHSLMPRLKEMEAQGAIESHNRAMLKQSIAHLLPELLETYLRLPADYASQVVVADGKTAAVVLLEQLRLIQQHVHEIEVGLLSSDVNALLANGRFLQQRLGGAASPLQ
jgi:hypothetical protein